MSKTVINDPVYGFISIPRGLLRSIVGHPFFQRLDRISQLGTSAVVYPGARHTRRAHSLGAYHLCDEAFRSLAEKGEFLFDSEVEQTEAAILMHDLGHGPFSHVLDSVFTPGISHEMISLRMMERINDEMHGELSMAVSIFKDEHPKRWLHELLSSQLDVDRLDYLCRDSFYTGVREGNVGAERIIKMLAVCNDRLVVNHKGIYSVENYLLTRRLMYWQVYLHKTTVSAEEVLRLALRRAKWLAQRGEELPCSDDLRYFLYCSEVPSLDDEDFLFHFARLDDSDILCALKAWELYPDAVLATLSRNFVERRLFKVDVHDEPITAEAVEGYVNEIASALGLTADEARWMVSTRRVKTELYSETAGGIEILDIDGTVRPLSEVSHVVRNETAGLLDEKHYLFHQRL